MEAVRWAFRLSTWQPSPQDWLLAARLVQLEEKERIGRFVFRRDAKASMAGRLLIRQFIQKTLGLKNTEMTLARDEREKPIISGPRNSEVLFNVSHQGDFAVLAGCRKPSADALLGVDIMRLEYAGGKNQDEFFRIMNRNFAPEEWRHIRSYNDDPARLSAFCRHWSLKESYVKATGTGITVNLQQISFEPKTALNTKSPICDTKLYVNNEHFLTWTFEEQLLDTMHCVSIARNFQCEPGMFKLVNFSDVISDLDPILPADDGYASNFISKDEKPS